MMKHIHLIGIGGTGLSAIARVLLEKGYTVSGSDRVASPLFKAITAAGAKTFLGHAADQIAGADLVIRSSAIPDDNPEVVAARSEGVQVVKRAEFLNQLTQDKDTLAVAGSHGKTTTTAMIIWLLEQLDMHPSFIVGGVVNQLGCNARAGKGLFFAIEADEYDYMFLGLSPKIAIITNIEHDHPDCFPTKDAYRAAFKDFLMRVRPDGIGILCWDDPETKSLMEELIKKRIKLVSYGTSSKANYHADQINYESGSPLFNLYHRQESGEVIHLGHVKLSVPGHHNVLNATAALAAIHQLSLPIEPAIQAMGSFSGTERRFEVVGLADGVTIIDDYGHHPTEIAATLEAARSRYPHRRIWAIWQPHTFSRTKSLENEFSKALQKADKVVVTKIYAAREKDPGYSSARIAESLPNKKGKYIENFQSVTEFLLENLVPNDVAIIFSAGDATEVSQAVLQGLKQRMSEAGKK